MKLIKLLLLIITITSITSCVTEQACGRKYPPKIINKDKIIIRDSLITVILHDTIFTKADTVHDSAPVYNNHGLLNSAKLIKELQLCKGTAQVINGKLNFVLMQKKAVIDSLMKHNIKIKTKTVYRTTTRVVKVYIHHWYSKIEDGLAIIALGIFLFLSARLVLNIVKKIP